MAPPTDYGVEWIEEVCGLYFRSILLQEGMRVPQHAHDHDHATYIGAGEVRVSIDGKEFGVFKAGQAVPVKAGHIHEFLALKNDTRLACVHDVGSAESIKAKGL